MDFANTVINAAAGQVAIGYGLRGVNATIAGGSAGAYAIAYAADLVGARAARALVAGGAEELCAESFHAFRRAGVLCAGVGEELPRPVPFGARRRGFVLGEGAGFVIVEHAESAARRGATPEARILGHATVSAGRGPGAADGIARAIGLALSAAGISPTDVDCVSASASGSLDGDAAEARGLAAALGTHATRVPLTAIKGMLGECLGASGAFEVVCLLETMKDGVLPGIPDFENADPDMNLGGLALESRAIAARTSLVVSAWDGTCTVLVLGAVDPD